MSAILWCRRCSAGYSCVGVVPIICPTCEQATTWASDSLRPRVRYELSRNDRLFLRGIHIEPDLAREDGA